MDTPLRSSAAERTRPTVWDGAVALGIVLAAALLFWLLLPRDTGGALTARITLDGTELGVYELSAVEEQMYNGDYTPQEALDKVTESIQAVADEWAAGNG